MPVPFPDDVNVLVVPPDAAEARTIAGGVANAVAADGELTGLQRLLLEALIESMTTFVVPVRNVPRLGPAEFARALARRSEPFRQRMLQLMLVCALVLVPLPDEVVKRIEEYASELGVTNDMLRVAERYAHGSLGVALIDFQRSGYMQAWDPSHAEVLHTSRALNDAWEQCVLDLELAERWESLRDLPEDSLGRAVARFYEARGFSYPGRPGSAPPLLAQHDWVHVIADYGSSVESELEVFAFDLTCANDDPRAVLPSRNGDQPVRDRLPRQRRRALRIRPWAPPHEGMAVRLVVRDAPGALVAAVRLADAMRRGALVAAHAGGPDLLGRDWFADVPRPIDEVRAEPGVVPKSEHAIERGSVTPWEPGGISAFQYESGRAAAQAAGRTYQSYGAQPT